MNKEEIDKWLDEEYGCSYTRLEELHDWLVDKDLKNREEIERLKDALAKIPRAKLEYDLELEDYKSRIDKAIEYIDTFKNDIRGLDEIVLLKILQGKDEIK